MIKDREIRELELVCREPWKNVAVSTGLLKEMLEEIKEGRESRRKAKEMGENGNAD